MSLAAITNRCSGRKPANKVKSRGSTHPRCPSRMLLLGSQPAAVGEEGTALVAKERQAKATTASSDSYGLPHTGQLLRRLSDTCRLGDRRTCSANMGMIPLGLGRVPRERVVASSWETGKDSAVRSGSNSLSP